MTFCFSPKLQSSEPEDFAGPALQPFAAQPYRTEQAFFIHYSKQSLNPGP